MSTANNKAQKASRKRIHRSKSNPKMQNKFSGNAASNSFVDELSHDFSTLINNKEAQNAFSLTHSTLHMPSLYRSHTNTATRKGSLSKRQQHCREDAAEYLLNQDQWLVEDYTVKVLLIEPLRREDNLVLRLSHLCF